MPNFDELMDFDFPWVNITISRGEIPTHSRSIPNRFHAKANATLLIDLQNFHFYDVTFREFVTHIFNTVVGDL